MKNFSLNLKKNFRIKELKNEIIQKDNLSLLIVHFEMVGITIIGISEKIIQKYLKSIETTGIRYVEIGFRFFEEKKLKD